MFIDSTLFQDSASSNLGTYYDSVKVLPEIRTFSLDSLGAPTLALPQVKFTSLISDVSPIYLLENSRYN